MFYILLEELVAFKTSNTTPEIQRATPSVVENTRNRRTATSTAQ